MKFRASGLDRIMHCPGSWSMEEKYPRTEHPAAAEGTEAHEDAARCLTTGTNSENEYVQEYVNFCRSIASPTYGIEFSGGFQVAGAEVTGTADFWTSTGGVLHVVDLKYGFGWVYPEENWQLIAYAIMISGNWEQKRVELHIVQPRAIRAGGPVFSWGFDGALLRNYRNQIGNQLGLAMTQNPPTVAGDHCRYCRAIVACETNRRTAGECLDVAGRSDEYKPEPVDIAAEFSRINSALERLAHRKTALEAHGVALIREGCIIPGYVAEQSWGRLDWIVDAITAGDDMGIDLRAPVSPMTPTQAKNKKLITPEYFGFMAARKPGEFKLKCVDMDAIRRLM